MEPWLLCGIGGMRTAAAYRDLCIRCLVLVLLWKSCSAQDAASPSVALPAKIVKLDLFRSVQVCAPLNVVVLPSQGGSSGNYSLAIESEMAAQEAIAATVVNGTLQLETVKDLVTSYPVKLAVYLPADTLQAVVLANSIAQVSVSPGFTTPTLELYSAFSTGNINVFNASVQQLTIGSSGTGSIFVNGSIDNATIAAGGTSKVILAGLQKEATLNLAGTATVYLGVTSADTNISGVATGVNSVTSNAGTCNVTSVFLFGSPCLTVDPLDLSPPNPQWSCGLNVTGQLLCAAGGIAEAVADSSIGTALGNPLPQMLLPLAATPSAAEPLVPSPLPEPSAASTTEQGIIPIATITPGTAGSSISVSPSGTIVRNVGSNQAGGRTAVASGSGSQTAIAVNTGSGRKLLQDTDFSDLYSLLGSSGSSVSSASVSSTPGTFSAQTGPGSIACTQVNGVGNCQATQAEAAAPGSTGLGNSAAASPSGEAGGDSGSIFSSPFFSSSSSSSGTSSPFTSSVTSGPGSYSSLCTTVNGVSKCETSSNGSPAVSTSTFTGFGPSPSASVPAGTIALSDTGAASLQPMTCNLPKGTSLNIF